MSDALGPLEGLLAGRVVCAPPADYRVEEVDVVVVGGGGAGLAAASAAAALGRRVVLLEKNAALGGSTAWSVGSVSASNTAHQRREGIMDCPEHHWEDLALFSGPELARDNRELARVLTSNAPETFEWLLSTGLRFVGPMPEPPHRRPRMHNVLPNSKAFPYHLGRHCRKLGVRIELDAKADALWMEDGRVKGVLATLPGSRGRVAWRALGGVVLAGGDFSGSPQLKATYASELVARVDAMNPGSTGEGIVLGLAAGAVVRNGDHLRGPFLRFVPPANPHWLQRLPPHPLVTELMAWAYRHVPSSLLRPLLMRFVTTSLAPEAAVFRAGAMLVDLAGRRIDLAGRNVHHAVADVQERMAYIVFDARAARLFTKWPNFVSTAPGVAYAYLDDYRNTRPDIFHEAPTVAALAKQLRVDAGTLEASLQQPADGGVQSHRSTQGPIFALGPAKAYVVFTNGGLDVSSQLEVLDANGAPIQGLYAAGSNGQGGLLLEGHGHHLMWAFASGRVAGRNCAYASTSAVQATQQSD